ncbi:glycosyltransferase [Pediococcus ethanolidurans]|uniref:glycosyltransferase n=1 Tax=Pediococcus ethanolidurans TaxID=319653 RepID=UPI0021E87391|nr:glycosyltransferase [Pediococcus ethanolidurans]MCV3316219.1 glycosyltransferase [Pediococcus ethanolidurans]
MSSIASQELENCQVLFVDDGSKDESVHVIEHYLQNHPQFNWQIVEVCQMVLKDSFYPLEISLLLY